MRGSLFEMFSVLQDADATPTPQATQAIPVLHDSTQGLVKQWEEIEKTELPQLKSQLGISALPVLSGEQSGSRKVARRTATKNKGRLSRPYRSISGRKGWDRIPRNLRSALRLCRP